MSDIKSLLLYLFLLVMFSNNSCKKDITLPVILTVKATNITFNKAISGGEIIDDGNSKKLICGICWSKATNPSIDGAHTIDVVEDGKFSSLMTKLEPETEYFYKAYATNEAGTSYGFQSSFKTTKSSNLPIVMFNGKPLTICPDDYSVKIKWGEYGVNTNAKSLNDGDDNCSKIIDKLGTFNNYAAKVCDELDAYGYTDWYLPSRDELKVIFENKSAVGNFLESSYWSSTEYDGFNAFYVSFINGYSTQTSKEYEYRVRCVRK